MIFYPSNGYRAGSFFMTCRANAVIEISSPGHNNPGCSLPGRPNQMEIYSSHIRHHCPRSPSHPGEYPHNRALIAHICLCLAPFTACIPNRFNGFRRPQALSRGIASHGGRLPRRCPPRVPPLRAPPPRAPPSSRHMRAVARGQRRHTGASPSRAGQRRRPPIAGECNSPSKRPAGRRKPLKRFGFPAPPPAFPMTQPDFIRFRRPQARSRGIASHGGRGRRHCCLTTWYSLLWAAIPRRPSHCSPASPHVRCLG